uniref:Uncharacterized protein n=1 Tax=Octactis speculum TaxID=3111310 RepID=A0A7S2C524_9STRA
MDEKSTGTEPLNSSLGDAADIGASPAVNTGGEEDLQNQVANNPAKKEAKIFELNPVQATRKLANFDIKFDTALSDHQGSREETGDRRKNSSAHAISIMDRCLFRIIASSAFNASPKISNGLVEKNKFGEIILEDSELMQYFPENLHKSKVHDMVTGSIKEEEKLLDFESIISILRREERDIMIDAPDRDIRKPSSTEVELEYKDDCEFVKVTSTDDAVQVARRFVFQNSLDVTQVEQYSDQVKESQLPICQADLKAGKVEARRLLKQVELTENLILENEAALEKAQEVANQHKLSLRDICKKVAVGKKNSAKTSSPGRKKYKSSTLVRNFAKKIIEAKRELEFNQRELERIKRASLALTQQHVRVVKSEKADKLWAKARRNFIKDRKDPKKIGTYDNVVHDALHHRSFGTIVNQLMDQRSILNKGQQGEIQNVDVDVEFATIAGNDMEFASVDKDNDNQLNRSEFDSWLLEKQAIMQKIQEDKRKLITEGMRLRKMVDENAESHAYELRLRARLIEHEGIEKQIKMEEMVKGQLSADLSILNDKLQNLMIQKHGLDVSQEPQESDFAWEYDKRELLQSWGRDVEQKISAYRSDQSSWKEERGQISEKISMLSASS